MKQYKILIDGEWIETGKWIDVIDKYHLTPFAQVARADVSIVNKAVAAAKKAQQENPLSPFQRYEILSKSAKILERRKEEVAQIISKETGKTVNEALGEISRVVNNFVIAAEESKRIVGEIVNIDAIQGNEKRFCFTRREPKGVIGCIAPFNVPLNLISHKVCPAIAAGNSVVLKPASATPVSGVAICEILEEAGLPAGYINLVPGPGGEIGDAMLENQDIAFYSFTGSVEVGKQISAKVGLRQCSLELGSNAGVIVCADADLEVAAKKCARSACANAGQLCISVQRVIVEESVKEKFVDLMVNEALSIKVGDPSDPKTDIGPMISEKEAMRAQEWVNEAVSMGAVVRCGGKRIGGGLFEPTVIDRISPEMKLWCEEAFAPILVVDTFKSFDEALKKVNNTKYGLQGGIFTSNVNKGLESAKVIQSGGVIINDVPTFRADNGPYGGFKNSGVGKEGVKYAIDEMTNLKVVVFNME